MRICDLTGKKTIAGNTRSESKVAVKRTFLANLHWKKFQINQLTCRLRVTPNAIRSVQKLGGLLNYLKKFKNSGNLSPKSQRLLKIFKD